MFHQEDVTIVNTYALSRGPSSFIKQMLQSLVSHDTVRMRDCNTQLSYPHQQRNFKVKLYLRPTGLNRCLQKTLHPTERKTFSEENRVPRTECNENTTFQTSRVQPRQS